MNDKINTMISNLQRFRINNKDVILEDDIVAVEEPLLVSIEHNNVITNFSLLMRTPGHDKALVYGLLVSEGIISRNSDVDQLVTESVDSKNGANQILVTLAQSVTFEPQSNSRQLPSYSACGLCGKNSLQALELKSKFPLKKVHSKLDSKFINNVVKQLSSQPLFASSGGAHVAGLIHEQGGVLLPDFAVYFEDVGRHNALDKLIGHELITNKLMQSGIVVLSGRVSFEMVQKSVMAGFSVILALGAPTSLAIQAAKQFQVSLIGFAKKDGFNLYTADKTLINYA
ncbi:MAG: formate dehydrogenase accessory sulfurtransferase FdhD [Gammaproteobacteria bacterium]|nr:formate dehydrogenase accessory sulfurtransferase FdhD [Gammaproteobacteria bacterium]MDH5630120.1 formate dehydrogenase accessory sulfurtransferase FdhD [Gammaproteobacteria bacterium]